MKKGIIKSACALVLLSAISSCKDYKKLATQFETNLPDSLEMLMMYENDEEDMHFVFYKSQDEGNYAEKDEFYKYNLATSTVDTIHIKNMVDPDSESFGLKIMCDNKNIAIFEQVMDGEDFEIYAYNPKTDKLKKFAQGDSFEMPNDSVLACIKTEEDARYIIKNYTSYSFNGKKLDSKVEKEERPIEVYTWQCKYCDKIVTSSQMPGDAVGRCIAAKAQTIDQVFDNAMHQMQGNRHHWVNIGRAR